MAAKKRKTKPGFRSATKKRSNPVRKGSYKAKRGYGFRRRRRNPETAGSLSMGNVGNALMGVGGAIVGYKFGTGLLGLQGNGKYIGGAIMTVGGYWLLEKIWPALAMPFGIAMGTLVVKDYLDESGVLDGLGSLLGIGGEMTEQDYNMLQEWNSGLGLIPGSSVQTMPVPQMPAGMEGSPRVANRSF